MNHLSCALLAFLTLALSLQAEKPGEKKPAATPAPAKVAPGMAQNVTPEEAEKILNTRKDVVVIDVRTEEEYETGHIPGAKNVSFISLEFAEQMKAYEGKPILVHCSSGSRSAKAIKQIVGKYPELFHLNGGIVAWQKAGKELVKSPAIPK